jgi:hypothetical protein
VRKVITTEANPSKRWSRIGAKIMAMEKNKWIPWNHNNAVFLHDFGLKLSCCRVRGLWTLLKFVLCKYWSCSLMPFPYLFSLDCSVWVINPPGYPFLPKPPFRIFNLADFYCCSIVVSAFNNNMSVLIGCPANKWLVLLF